MKSLKKKFEIMDAEATRPASEGEASPVDINSHRAVRWGLGVLILGFGGFMLWAMLAPLDAGVTSPGSVKVASNRKTIQHLTGGTVDAILVREGQAVKKNQVLVKLNPTQSGSQLGMAEAQFISAKAVESRLVAERDGKTNLEPIPELKSFGDDLRVKEAIALQTRLFTTRRSSLDSEIRILEENLAAALEQLHGQEQVRKSRQQQLGFLNEELKGVREMAREGYVPRNRMLGLERDALQINGSLAEDLANIGRTHNQIAELKLRILQRRQEYQKEVQSLLTDVQKDANAQADRLSALRYEFENTQIKSPIDGIVVGLNVHTVGGVIQPGFHIMDVVPRNEPMVVEAQVAPQLIDKVHPGLPVELSFPAFSHAKTPNVPGVVDTVSADRLVDERTNMPYYLVQVKVTDKGLVMLGQNQIRPGMPASVVVKTGERTMLNYLIKPLLDRVDGAFKEQ
ncbi:HlyD family type I secretion periplasmic adaptor subunit [Microvirgula aerodenitrificans]|uniref:HlyD family type I secretion periplasmic adaptor subunit n=1 Tax=Microvirgula aerodenitrificans TaxID=57480 RepID=UPI001B8043F4|nr:HlyD family type I secretion periplasmic adaptor subunit [Microvirgula aerodenitrificans]